MVTNDKVSIAKLQQRGGISISNVNAADGSYEFTVTYTSNSNAETFKFTKTDSDTADFAIHSKSDSHTWSMIKQSDSVGEQWIFDVPEVQTPAPPTDATSRAVIAPPDWAIGEWIGVVINSVDATAMTLVVSANDMSIDLIGKDRVLLAELERDGAISISDTTTTDDRYQFTVTYSHNDASETLAFRRIRSDSADFTVHSQAGSDTWSMVKL